MWRGSSQQGSLIRAGRSAANFLIPSDSRCPPALQSSVPETRGEKREGQQSHTSPSFKCPFQFTPAHPSCLFQGKGMETALPGTGLSCFCVLCHTQQGDSPRGQQGREALGGPRGGVWPSQSRAPRAMCPVPRPSPALPRRASALMRLPLQRRVGVGLGTSGEIKQIPGKVSPTRALLPRCQCRVDPPCPQRLLPHGKAQQPSCRYKYKHFT